MGLTWVNSPMVLLGGSSNDKLPELAHQKALEESLGIKDQSCPVARGGGVRLSHKTVW